MDLLIKDLEMTDRPIKLVLYPNGDVDHLTEDNRYETIAKAIEIPPHGRLIDADRIADDFEVYLATTSPLMQRRVAEGMVDDVRLATQITPTILEASVNNDDDHSYEMQSDMRDHCERYEPTYNPEDGSM